jgi:hypothetical protein
VINVAPYLARRFDLAESNCWHLTRDAWLELTGLDLGDRTPERITTAALIGRFASDVPTFTRLEQPVDPCVVLMRRPGAVPHVGVYMSGRVLQMTPTGASFLPMRAATIGFPLVEFYQ